METNVVKGDPHYLVIGIPLKPVGTAIAMVGGYYVTKKYLMPMAANRLNVKLP